MKWRLKIHQKDEKNLKLLKTVHVSEIVEWYLSLKMYFTCNFVPDLNNAWYDLVFELSKLILPQSLQKIEKAIMWNKFENFKN